MRKNQTLLVAGILLLASTAVAQAQAVYDVFSNAVPARDRRCQGELSGERGAVLENGSYTTRGVVTLRVFRPARKGPQRSGW